MVAPRHALAFPVLALGLACGGTPAPEGGTDGPSTSAAVDTATLSGESARLAGFTTATVQREAWRDTWRAPARLVLDAAGVEAIGSIVEGRVMHTYVLPGDRVVKDQVLAAIHSHEMMDARAAKAQAIAERARTEANARVAQSAAERGSRLYDLRATSLAELERLRAALADAEAARDRALAEERRATEFLDHLLGDGALPPGYDEHWVLVRAPLDGVVIERQVQPGNVVLVGAPLFTVGRPQDLTLVIQLPDAAGAAARVGADVRFTVAAAPTEPQAATVTRVYPSVDTVSRTIEVHARVQGTHASLRPEMFATAELQGSPGGARVLVVPSAAVQALEGDTVVIGATRSGDGLRLEALPVQIGRRTSTRAEVLRGLDSGRTIIVDRAAIAKAELLKRRAGG